jgi:hypothetical protein
MRTTRRRISRCPHNSEISPLETISILFTQIALANLGHDSKRTIKKVNQQSIPDDIYNLQLKPSDIINREKRKKEIICSTYYTLTKSKLFNLPDCKIKLIKLHSSSKPQGKRLTGKN